MKTVTNRELAEIVAEERAKRAALQLLDALEAAVAHKNAIHMDETVYLNCLIAIKAAKGE